ncbi:putative zinc-binding protein [Marinobacterium lacunae]|uniref:Putative zinc-binding protein n=1 Tax=Marinobacterium lacunae TaxID=1232683 RepID=A0A081FVQ1_9GAMM|nr:DUF2796 domain-containing protein [Marinobacterium lacunae]KEA62606.1 putative zinc-binding protein [Marinobacterium lacunae]
MPSPNPIALSLAAMLTATSAFADGDINSHTHGNATLQLAFRNQELVIYLRAPAVDMVGFEHQAMTAEENTRERQLDSNMRSPAYWITLPEAAGCALSQVHLGKHHVISGRGVAPEIMDGNAPSVTSEHMDLNFTYSFLCANPQQFNRAEVKLFEHFPSLEKVNVKVAGFDQTRLELTPGNSTLQMP